MDGHTIRMTQKAIARSVAAGLLCLLLVGRGLASGHPSLQQATSQAGILTELCRKRVAVTEAESARGLAAITKAVTASRGNVEDLARRLTSLGEGTRPSVTRADTDGDGQPDIVISFGWCAIPIMVFRAAAPGQAVTLSGPGNVLNWHGSAGARIDRVADVNSDGKPELVIEFHAAGGSAAHKWVYIYQWKDGQFHPLFHDQLSDWVGENHWSVEPGTVTVQCHPFGPYEFKMMEHRQQTDVYRWHPEAQRYELTKRSVQPVPSRHLQVTKAEQSFQQGQYDVAAEEFRKVSKVPVLHQHRDAPDWVTYAHLRHGQIYALQGRKREALAELSQVTATEEQPLATLAGIFQRYYLEQDVAEAFYQAWRWIRLEAYDPGDPTRLSALWPWMLEPKTLGARQAILDAYEQVGRRPTSDLPEAGEYRDRSYLEIGF